MQTMLPPLMPFAAGPGPNRFLSISWGFRRGQQDLPGRDQGLRLHPSPDTNLCHLPPLPPEPVSHPSIQILSRVLANGSCAVTLNCTTERGDNVSYNWASQDLSTSGLCSHNGSLLHLSYSLQDASIACACTASNPISSRVVTFNSSECNYEHGGESPLGDVAVPSLPALLLLCRGLFSCCFQPPHRNLPQEKRPLRHPLSPAPAFP